MRVGGSIFAATYRDRLLLKLPERDVTELLTAGLGQPFCKPGQRPYREWVLVPLDGKSAPIHLSAPEVSMVFKPATRHAASARLRRWLRRWWTSSCPARTGGISCGPSASHPGAATCQSF